MRTLTYTKLNNLLGWGVGLFALIVYALTVEPTASYWDCSEFIAVSYKLEVPHPPGAPLYLMLGRMFSLLAAGDTTRVAFWVNMLSVLTSALTITFLFWTITALARRMYVRNATESEATPPKGSALQQIMGAGVLGSLVFTFSDSFWFSAVEAEVYGLSSLFTAVIVWAILRWETMETAQQRWQWLILISYIVGLSIGVHLLGLVALPAMALLIYYREYGQRANNFGVIVALALGMVAVGLIMVGIIQGLPGIAAGFDIFFVNTLGLPFYSGIVVFLLLFFGGLVASLVWAYRRQYALTSTLLLSLCFVLLGYSSYMLVLIRSGDNPPIDENNPEDVLKFISYLKREQYGDRPLLYGHHYASRMVGQEKGEPVYRKGDKEYEIVDWSIDPVYDKKEQLFFPRMYSQQGRHKRAYAKHLGLGEKEKPSSADNLRFLFGYQVGHMYIRYLMWNFAGRHSDEEGAEWLSPIEGLEALSNSLPTELSNNKARNNYWALPFLFGLLGLIYHAMRDHQGFRFVMLLFLFMGVGLVFYLNMPPEEPRERDYIFAGSYYTFAIWVGLAFVALMDWGKKYISRYQIRLAVCSAISLLPIFLMAKENWDDHDRSGRYFSVDSARNLLESCAPNAILFTGGDNDTFPLWYAQEVEGIRTDVRVIVLSYFNTEWYIEQMTRPAYASAPLPFSIDIQQYAKGGLNDLLYIAPRKGMKRPISLSRYLDLVRVADSRLRLETSAGTFYNMVPSRTVVLEVDTAKVRAEGVVPKAFDDLLTDRIHIELKGNYMEKKDLALLDLLSAQDWSRPIYFNHTSLRGVGMTLEPYVVQEGLSYRFLPIQNDGSRRDTRLMDGNTLVDVERMYENVMKKFRFRSLQNESIYLNGDFRNFIFNHRAALSTLSAALYKTGDTTRAKKVLRYSLKQIPDAVVPYEIYGLPTVAVALAIGEREKAIGIADGITERAAEWLSFDPSAQDRKKYEAIIQRTASLFRSQGEKETAQRYTELLRRRP